MEPNKHLNRSIELYIPNHIFISFHSGWLVGWLAGWLFETEK